MKVGILINILKQFDPALEVCVHVEYRQHLSNSRIELRDVLKSDIGSTEQEATVLQIWRPNSHAGIGWPHLTDDERKTKRREILEGLSDDPMMRGSRRFTRIHGDFMLYHDYGGSQDTCYGTAYDPRIWIELEAEGLIAKRGGDYHSPYYVTDAGKALLETLR